MTAPAWLTARPIAHRGLHDRAAGRPENTIGAALAAVAGGFAIECDVQLSRDGEAMVVHDHALERLTGEAGLVGERDSAALEMLRVQGSDERIPALAAFLDAVGGRVPVVVEVKSRFGGDERLVRRVVEVVAARDGAPVAVKSFDPTIVSAVRRLAPALPRGIVAESTHAGAEWQKLPAELRRSLAELLHWEDTLPDFLSWNHRDLPDGPPFLARRLGGRPVRTWTIRSEAEAAAARAHADQIVFEGFIPG